MVSWISNFFGDFTAICENVQSPRAHSGRRLIAGRCDRGIRWLWIIIVQLHSLSKASYIYRQCGEYMQCYTLNWPSTASQNMWMSAKFEAACAVNSCLFASVSRCAYQSIESVWDYGCLFYEDHSKGLLPDHWRSFPLTNAIIIPFPFLTNGECHWFKNLSQSRQKEF